jgi:hypothetical protein
LVYFGVKTIDTLLFFSILISIGFEYASWYGIEKKALFLKNDSKELKFKK